MSRTRFTSIRITEETKDWTKDLRTAFESCYLRRFTFDEFLEKLRDCVEDGDPAVWEKFCQMVHDKQKEG